MDDALEADDGEEARGEAGDPGEQEDGEGDEGVEAGGVGQAGGLDLLRRGLAVREEELLARRRAGRPARRRLGLAGLHGCCSWLSWSRSWTGGWLAGLEWLWGQLGPRDPHVRGRLPDAEAPGSRVLKLLGHYCWPAPVTGDT